VFHAADFDIQKAEKLLASSVPEGNKAGHNSGTTIFVELLDLASRKCYWNGRPLVLPKMEAGKARTSIGAMVHMIMHTAHRLAVDISQQRSYMRKSVMFISLEMYTYDPRFLVFEYLSTFLLRARQVCE
jgi:hypothetical protein